jgi:hypothetical protein
MFEFGKRLGVVVAMSAVVGGCAPSMATTPLGATADRPPSADGPTNFAHPQDMIQRYPTMRRQDL